MVSHTVKATLGGPFLSCGELMDLVPTYSKQVLVSIDPHAHLQLVHSQTFLPERGTGDFPTLGPKVSLTD